jgi:Na+-driven multidrug efflux pump
VGYSLCFVLGLGVVGLWVGLSIGLVAVAIALMIVWWKSIHLPAAVIATE